MIVKTRVRPPPIRNMTTRANRTAIISGRWGWILAKPMYGTSQRVTAATTRPMHVKKRSRMKILFSSRWFTSGSLIGLLALEFFAIISRAMFPQAWETLSRRHRRQASSFPDIGVP